MCREECFEFRDRHPAVDGDPVAGVHDIISQACSLLLVSFGISACELVSELRCVMALRYGAVLGASLFTNVILSPIFEHFTNRPEPLCDLKLLTVITTSLKPVF